MNRLLKISVIGNCSLVLILTRRSLSLSAEVAGNLVALATHRYCIMGHTRAFGALGRNFAVKIWLKLFIMVYNTLKTSNFVTAWPLRGKWSM